MLTSKEKSDSKTILLIGSTGKGKSALANVLANKVNKDDQFENFQEIFEESNYGVSKTRETKCERFKSEGVEYEIIDTVGIGDTKLKKEEVLDKIAEATYLTRKGISQIFFIIDGRFDKYEMANYDLLRTIIFDNEVANHTTIVRTRFENFTSTEKCQKDIDLMVKEGGELAEIIKSCQKRVIYVDNPSLYLLPDDVENEDERKKAEKEVANEIADRKKIRSVSRKLLLEHLKKVCQENFYKPSKLQALNAEIIEYMENKINLKEELRKLDNYASEPSSPSIISEEQTESLAESGNKLYTEREPSKKFFELVGESDKLKVVQKIAHLESEGKWLRKQIAINEKIIRQKVLMHIFNNYDNISNELGGDVLLNNVVEDNNNWKTISQEFTDRKLVLEWKGKGFSYQEIQEWIRNLGNIFSIKLDAGFCAWLRDVKHLAVEEIKELDYPQGIEKLREWYAKWLEEENKLHKNYIKKIVDWIDIHPDFAERFNNQTFQEIWEENGITKEEAKEWVEIGFDPYKRVGDTAYLCLPQDWKSQGLSLQDAKKWKEVGLETTEYGFADYLRIKKYDLSVVRNNLNILREEYKEWRKSLSAQEYLDFFYPREKRNEFIRLNIIHEEFAGSLNTADFGELKELDCSYNKLAHLDVSQNQKLTQLYCYGNQLTNESLLLPKQGGKITDLYANHNHFTDLTPFTELVNCKKLYLHNNPLPNNSLKPLQKLKNLEGLGIDNNQLNWEYLPANLKTIHCPGSLIEKLKKYQTENSYFFDSSSGFSYNYQAWRRDHQELIQQIEIPPK